jgi:hypothetical protein
MKISIFAMLVFTAVFAISVGTTAQDNAPKVHNMTGCLKAGSAPGTFMLTNVEKGPKTVGIVSSTVNLTPHIGHKVQITGTAVPEAEAMKENKEVPKAPHYMKVTAMKHIAATCP